MKNKMKFQLFVLVAFFICLALASGEQDEPKESDQTLLDEWRSIQESVFRIGGNYMDTEETYEYLKRLNKLYPKVRSMLTSKENGAWQYRHRKAFEIANISEQNCTLVAMDRLKGVISEECIYTSTIGPFLLEVKKRQIALCQPILAENLEQVVSGLTDEQRKDIKLLTDKIVDVERANRIDSKVGDEILVDSLVRGSLKFLLIKKVGLTKNTSKDTFNRIFGLEVKQFCHSIRDELSEASELYKLIVKFSGQRDYTSDSIDWDLSERICDRLANSSKNLVNQAFTELRGRSEQKPNKKSQEKKPKVSQEHRMKEPTKRKVALHSGGRGRGRSPKSKPSEGNRFRFWSMFGLGTKDSF